MACLRGLLDRKLESEKTEVIFMTVLAKECPYRREILSFLWSKPSIFKYIVNQRMHFGKIYFITSFSRTCDRHQGVSKNTNKIYNKLLICTGEMTWCYA